MSNFDSLNKLGWQQFFLQQLSLQEWDTTQAARIIEQHRSEITVSTCEAVINIKLTPTMPSLVVGDWVLLDSNNSFNRLLDRQTCFSRKAAGSKVERQLIAANVNTAFIVTSMNDEFNLNRIERFLALVNEAGAKPVVVLSKSDQADDPDQFVQQVQTLDTLLTVEAVNCLDPNSVSKLAGWINESTTISVLGSSGVGKSTLVNTLLSQKRQKTSGIREGDDKGRHTTTRRSLLTLPGGGLILDTPGMREIQLSDAREGIAATFEDIERIAENCRYNDCQHQTEPGCTVRNAIDAGELDARRVNNYHKLLREEALNSASLAERRANDKSLGKFYKRTLSESHQLKGRS